MKCSEEISVRRKCDCKKGFEWKTNSTYKSHFKSNRHILWMEKKEKRDIQAERIRIENENGNLRQKLVRLHKRCGDASNIIIKAEKEIRKSQKEISRAQARISAKKSRKRSLVQLANANQKLLESQEKLEKARDVLHREKVLEAID